MRIEDVKEYEIIRKDDISELKSKGYLLRHKKSGARICILSNDDRNKVFYVAFRTPPADSCGTPHILEHTVLCGSRKYTAKDPFIELAKGSLNTFLNAMTYPDKTVYPVASTNDKDFANLSDVYMDAVLHPAIYDNEMIFKQEGWHYELENEDDDLKINGVVYNEMKGAFSAPDDVLDRFIFNSLYPDNAYALESGGDPEEIPNLTYERFLELHRKYYHPCNSYIYLYGDCDMAERLRWLDRDYLSHYDRIDINSKIVMQKPFKKRKECEKNYSLSDGESMKENTYLSLNYVIEDNLDPKLYLAFQILQYALLDAQGAPLKQALLDRGIGKDIDSIYENGILQPYFSIVVKYSDEEKKDEFVNAVNEVLKDQVKKGLERDTLLAGLNTFEFRHREADFGYYPKGLMYGLQCLDSWLYDENEPFMHIQKNATFDCLRKEIEGKSGYFEGLIKKYLLDNTHSSMVLLKPEKGLTAKRDKKTADKLKKYKDSLSREEIQKIIRETGELKKYQSEPSTEKQLKTIPVLNISDIEKKVRPVKNDERIIDGNIYLHHDIYTNGIAYIGLMFSMQSLPVELLGAAGLLRSVLGSVDTEHYSYQELNTRINLLTGGIYADTTSYGCNKSPKDFYEEFEIRVKVKDENIREAFELIREIVFTSDFSDRKRLKEIVSMLKSKLQASMPASGHTVASGRALSYINDAQYYIDKLSGIDYYRFIDDLENDFDKKIGNVQEDFKKVLDIILHTDNFMTDMTGSKEAFEQTVKCAGKIKAMLSAKPSKPADIVFDRKVRNEGLRTAGQVQYVAKAANFLDKGLPYRGELKVLKVIMGYDYLWNNVRVLGGAYGCSSAYSRYGNIFMVSYRDPHLGNTLKVFEEAADYISSFKVSKRDMTKFIIGTVADMDMPLNPKAEGARSLSIYMSEIDIKTLQEERDAVLSCSTSKIRELAPYLKLIADDNVICVVGAEEKIDENRELFGEVRNLL